MTPRGAVYIPARAWNAYQIWHEFDATVVRRDLGYAKLLNLDALRTWLSYEYWLEKTDDFEREFDQFLTIANDARMKVLISLFECCGIEPTDQSKHNHDPQTAFCIKSPGAAITKDPAQWGKCVEYIHWFMHHFGCDPRLCAIEIINEPQRGQEMKFAQAMFKESRSEKQSIPLTIGQLRWDDRKLFDLDILQMHENFHRDEKELRNRLDLALAEQKATNKDVWITEWQRLRPHGSGWGNEPVVGDEWQPAYATMAPIIHSSPLGSFFWSLMIKPAYLPSQRRKGSLNGVFHEDGAVWSLEDARAIAQNPNLQLPERTLPKAHGPAVGNPATTSEPK